MINLEFIKDMRAHVSIGQVTKDKQKNIEQKLGQ